MICFSCLFLDFVDTAKKEHTDSVELMKKLCIDAEVQVSEFQYLMIVESSVCLEPIDIYRVGPPFLVLTRGFCVLQFIFNR